MGAKFPLDLNCQRHCAGCITISFTLTALSIYIILFQYSDREFFNLASRATNVIYISAATNYYNGVDKEHFISYVKQDIMDFYNDYENSYRESDFPDEDTSHSWSSISKHFSDKQVCFAGLVRDSSKTITFLLSQIEWMAMNIFNKTNVIILESKSKDNTRQVLNKWISRHNANADFTYDGTIFDGIDINTGRFSVDLLDSAISNRILNKYIQIISQQEDFHLISRIAKFVIYRNFLLEYIKTTYSDCYLLFMVDFDGAYLHIKSILGETIDGMLNDDDDKINNNFQGLCVNGYESGFKKKGVLTDYNYNSNYGNIIANFTRYRDSFALILNDKKWYHKSAMNREEFLQFINEKRFQPVLSCFGSLTVYNLQFLISNKISNSECRYYYFSYDTQGRYKGLSPLKQYSLFLQMFEETIDDYTCPKIDNCNKSQYASNQEMIQDMKKWTEVDPMLRSHRLPVARVCEHVPFHYCLTQHAGFKLAMARDALYSLKYRKRLT